MKRVVLVAAIATWLAVILAVTVAVWRYKQTPSAAAVAPVTWPADSTLARTAGRPQLLVFAHPQCPCTRATMSELAKLAANLHGTARIHVVLVRPDGTEPGFEEGTIAARARAIPGAEVSVDVGGFEAERFGALTSGTVVAYTATGLLVFSGGITTARGHEGRSPAADRIVAGLTHDNAERRDAPVYGCGLGTIATVHQP